MSLSIVATSIGNDLDLSLRAQDVLRNATVIIGEERAHASKLLKRLGIETKRLELLNEHSKENDLQDLVEICRVETCALISDAGTPVFCDPGARLVELCRAQKIPVIPIPGASSLMTLLSVSSEQLKSFVFLGFLPRETEERTRQLGDMARESRAMIVMDTPYRLERLLSELSERMGERRALLGMDLTLPTERLEEDRVLALSKMVAGMKAEFVLLIYADSGAEKTPRYESRPATARPLPQRHHHRHVGAERPGGKKRPSGKIEPRPWKKRKK